MSIDLDAIQARVDAATGGPWTVEPDIPSLISLVRELQAAIPARVVLDGDPVDVAAALDALPDRAVVTSEKLVSFDMFLKQPQVSTRGSAWYQAGFAAPIDSGFLARNYSPMVVLR